MLNKKGQTRIRIWVCIDFQIFTADFFSNNYFLLDFYTVY